MATKIIVCYGDKKKIQEALNASAPTIRKALNGDYNSANADESALAIRIRKYAIEIGGVELKRPKK